MSSTNSCSGFGSPAVVPERLERTPSANAGFTCNLNHMQRSEKALCGIASLLRAHKQPMRGTSPPGQTEHRGAYSSVSGMISRTSTFAS